MAHYCPTCGDWVRDNTRHRCPDLVTTDNVGTTVLAHGEKETAMSKGYVGDFFKETQSASDRAMLSHVSSERHDTELFSAWMALRDLSARCRRAYQLIEGSDDGMTDAEGRECFFSFPQRRADLYHAGLVRDSGKRRTTPRGAEAIVWEVTG